MTYTASIAHQDKPRSGIALGGIGTGGIEIRKDGVFYNWHIFNNVPFGCGARLPFAEDSLLFFIVRYQEPGCQPRMKLLQIDSGYGVAAIPNHYYIFPWLTGVQKIDYRASFPFVWMEFQDEEMPFVVELEAFSPFIPHDVKNSALPAVLFNFKIRPTTDRPVDVMLMASLRNAAGYDIAEKTYTSRLDHEAGCPIGQMGIETEERERSSAGTLALAACGSPEAGLEPSYYLGWEHVHPYYEIALRSKRLPDTDDTDGRNPFDRQTGKRRAMERLFSTLAVSGRLEPDTPFASTFIFSWNFPNFFSEARGEEAPARLEGNYYSNFFDDAATVARYVISNRAQLDEKTRAFWQAYCDTTVPPLVLEQVNSQLNTFVTSSWLTRDGKFGIIEGLTPDQSWGPLATIDVALYGSQPTEALFPELFRRMMLTHRDLQRPSGQVSHGFPRNFQVQDGDDRPESRLDMPAQFVILALRYYLKSGDRAYLDEVWPAVKCAIDYVLRERDANGDGMPDMTGIMSSYDNFPMYGVSAYVGSLWLSALQHAAAVADELGDGQAKDRYAQTLARALPVFEERLWNGAYYRLYNDIGGSRGDLDDACLTDQIVGQWASRCSGLPALFRPERVRSALHKILEMSYEPGMGLRNCRWPADGYLHDIDADTWVDQGNTCWSGVELAFAAFLIHEGLLEDGLAVTSTVDERYRKSGMYFDHIEFGGHYFRPMAAWNILEALLGYSVRGDCYTFAPRQSGQRVQLLFTTQRGYGHYIEDGDAGTRSLLVKGGQVEIRTVRFAMPAGWKSLELWVNDKLQPENSYAVQAVENGIEVRLSEKRLLSEGQQLHVKLQ